MMTLRETTMRAGVEFAPSQGAELPKEIHKELTLLQRTSLSPITMDPFAQCTNKTLIIFGLNHHQKIMNGLLD